MTSQPRATQPKYQRIADDLKREIDAGRYRPGDRLPGENDLMATYGVARMTARQALGVLQGEGIAEARRGVGVFVREFRPIRRRGIQRLAGRTWGGGASVWSADIASRELAVDQLSVTEREAPEQIAAVLGLKGGEPACVRSRRFVLDGKPVLLSDSYLPAALVAGSRITDPDTGPGGTYARLAELGHKPVHFQEQIRSRMPAGDEADRLALAPGTPVFLVHRIAFAEDGQAVEVNEMVLDSASYILEYDFDA
ncbi:GntR family transcriptional regulator [Kitasatospora sp. NA04385]|uniref:GntR family transcriptional regulator n=1 Tax=Kitasatospora sp. NA04385 TaxID=2742135 RepID=UPI001591E9EF|nr:GntR family transcriptional regulator [Kitasatospora sp. NA04385]QKW20083.1 GntR family transcriptional regulator [Kitasatospora sp. NA04385]